MILGAPREIAVVTILEAAEKIFSEHGFSGASIAAVAREAGIPKANIHYYFSTKETLYQEVLRRTVQEWLRECEIWLRPENKASTALRAYIGSKLAFSRANPHASRLFAHEIIGGARYLHDYLSTTLREAIAPFGETFGVWMERGEIPQVDPTHFLFCLWAMTQWYADMQPQVTALLGKETLEESDFNVAAETILALVLARKDITA
ncbi:MULTISPECIES: TetR family transcriptional regulator C-terminal domain-containing protein [Asaia]|uniref:TetR family transcriptional regulator C-terminal domain-containing protein n=1 Tax=Asaia TaxID=91914 RepID=UPI000EFBD491|nr:MULTISPECIES: TetR family transcriptional regulator C-terminal domain-containing protein [Asaia]NIE79057.1 TetR family transcriptional regulator [Asaia sp. As-1742]